MQLQNDAQEIIDRVSMELDPLFKQHGFDTIIRRSDTSIFSEILSYQKDIFEIRITACLHPHDYPNRLSISLIMKTPGGWKYVHSPELFNSLNETISFSNDDLMIYPLNNFDKTLSKLHQYADLILKNLNNSKSNINFR